MSNKGSPMTQAPQPPKPPLIRNGPATRKLTSSGNSLTTGRTKEDMIAAPAFSSSIHTPATAKKFLVDRFLMSTNQDPDHSSLSHALLHLTFTTQGITAPTADAIRAVAILIDSLTPPPTPPGHASPQQNDNPGSIESQISLLGTYIEALHEVTALNTSSASVLT